MSRPIIIDTCGVGCAGTGKHRGSFIRVNLNGLVRVTTYCLLCLLLIGSTGFGQYYRGVRLIITIKTTSDWCRLEVGDAANLVTLDYTVLRDESPNEKIGTLAINQPGNTALVEVAYTTFLVLESLGPALKLISTKGDWGDVTITVEGYRNGFLTRIRRFQNQGSVSGDPTNRREFEIQADRLLELDRDYISVGLADTPHTVFVFYYPWYGSPSGPHGDWFHWDPSNHYASTHEPLLGYYDSGSPAIQRQHLQWAQEHGVDVFICSWWGIGSYEDRRFAELLRQALNYRVKLTIYFETNRDIENSEGPERVAAVTRHLRYILVNYSSHRSFFKLNGIPVIFLYGLPLSRLSIEEWAGVIENLRNEGHRFLISVDSYNVSAVKLFDAFHTYNPLYHTPEELRSIFIRNQLLASYHHKIFAATILPGYDDTVIRDPGKVVPREGGAFYEAQWEVVAETQPSWVLITSWNEWHEGTEIEPSVEFGDLYLQLTAAGRARWDSSRWFVRGDANGDGTHDLGDAVTILNYLFNSERINCEDALDANDDGFLDLADAIYLLAYLFAGGPVPPEPFPVVGPDPTADELGCRRG